LLSLALAFSVFDVFCCLEITQSMNADVITFVQLSIFSRIH